MTENRQYLTSERQELARKQLLSVIKRYDTPPKVLDIDFVLPAYMQLSKDIERTVANLHGMPDWDKIGQSPKTFDMVIVADNMLESKLLGWHYQKYHEVLKDEGLLMVHCLNSQRYTKFSQNWNYTYKIGNLLTHAPVNGFVLWQSVYSGEYPQILGLNWKTPNMREYVTLLFSKASSADNGTSSNTGRNSLASKVVGQ